MRNIKLLLGLWFCELQILWKDINLFRLRCILDYKAFKLDNLNEKLSKGV